MENSKCQHQSKYLWPSRPLVSSWEKEEMFLDETQEERSITFYIWLLLLFCFGFNFLLSLHKARTVLCNQPPQGWNSLWAFCTLWAPQTNVPPKEKQMISLWQVSNSPCEYSLYASTFFLISWLNWLAIMTIKVQIVHIISARSVQTEKLFSYHIS